MTTRTPSLTPSESRIQVLRINDRVLGSAGHLLALELRSLDAIHLASAEQLGAAVRQIVTYDERMAEAARAIGWTVVAPDRPAPDPQ